MVDDEAWRKRANCRGYDTAIFYVDHEFDELLAKSICAWCPVMKDCLMYALDNNEQQGIWGGKNDKQRQKILKARKLAKSDQSNDS